MIDCDTLKVYVLVIITTYEILYYRVIGLCRAEGYLASTIRRPILSTGPQSRGKHMIFHVKLYVSAFEKLTLIPSIYTCIPLTNNVFYGYSHFQR